MWDREAEGYDRQIAFFERVLFEGGREWACSQARGDVLEVAIGTGRNLPFYPPEVRITGVELSPAMLAIARERAKRLERAASFVEGDAQRLPFPSESFDAVVCTLSLCNIPDVGAAVVEMRRVLRQAGRLLLVDHIRSSVRLVRWIQRLMELLTVRLGGDHLVRRPLEAVVRAGFVLERHHRSKWGIV